MFIMLYFIVICSSLFVNSSVGLLNWKYMFMIMKSMSVETISAHSVHVSQSCVMTVTAKFLSNTRIRTVRCSPSSNGVSYIPTSLSLYELYCKDIYFIFSAIVLASRHAFFDLSAFSCVTLISFWLFDIFIKDIWCLCNVRDIYVWE